LNKLERFGAGASLLCAIHCAATPVLLAVLPFLGSRLAGSHWAEILLIGVAASVGYLTLSLSFRRHRRPLPLCLLTLGLALVGIGHTPPFHQFETIVAVTGGLTLAGAQFLNRRYAGPCSCGHAAHGHAAHDHPTHEPSTIALCPAGTARER
jgi:MerC mercury resistance protein